MGSFLFRRQAAIESKQPQPVLEPPKQIAAEQPKKKVRYKVVQYYDPKPIFKPISQNKLKAIQKSPVINELINNQIWNINPEIVEHLIIFNAFEHIQVSNAHVLQVSLFRNVINSTFKFQGMRGEEKMEREQKHLKQEPILQIYSQIYASLFDIKFLHLKKLKIQGQKQEHQQAITSLQLLQYLDCPLLEELHADGHNLTSVKFLRKCHWKYLQTLSLRETKISDSSQFASVLPYISNSKHIQIINMESRLMSQKWFEVSWLIKMGYANAENQRQHMNQDDESFYMNQARVLRRIEFGISKTSDLRKKHIEMIKKKFNNHYIDNPLVLW